MGVWKLRASMAGTMALIIGISTLFFAVVLSLTGYFDFLTLGFIVVALNIVQWLISPYLIDAMYHTKPIAENEQPKLHEIVNNISQKSGIKKPKLMLAQIPLPNAFAYGSPIAGTRVAVTSGLMNTLNDGEVEAVLGHELGHLKHRDVQVMMFVSILPAIAYYIGYTTMLSSAFSSGRNRNDMAPILGVLFIAFSWVMNLFILGLSRQREYYADRHSATTVENGSQKLSTGLAKIVSSTRNMHMNKKQTRNLAAFKALFIADPDRAEVDSVQLSSVRGADAQKMVDDILSKKLTTGERILEIFSTHPNIIKRLKALRELN
jgi:heat shock protein HtpX